MTDNEERINFGADAATKEHPAEKEKISAVNRSLHHVDQTKWFTMLFATAFARWSFQHPFRVAMARKRTHREELSTGAVMKELYAEKGVRGVFRGLGTAATGNALGETGYIAIFENLRDAEGSDEKTKTLSHVVASPVLRDAIASTVADVSNVVIAAPFDVISMRQATAGSGMVRHHPYVNSWQQSRLVFQECGYRGFFAGLVPNLLYSPSSALWWTMYNPAKSWLYSVAEPILHPDNVQGNKFGHWCHERLPVWLTSADDNAALNALAGVISSVTCTALYNPVLVVSTRLQVGTASDQLKFHKGSKIVFVLKDLWQNEGAKGLFKGMGVNLAMAVAEGLLFSQVYEVTKLMCELPTDDS